MIIPDRQPESSNQNFEGRPREFKDVQVKTKKLLQFWFGLAFMQVHVRKERLKVQFTARRTISMTV